MERFPLSYAALERYRLTARKRAPAGQVGAHMLRRRGQSLEFREYAQYRPGDDYRYIDWRASARLRQPRELLVRRFEAEEQMTLALSVDNRATMALIEGASKLRLAAWLTYALATIAVSAGDRVLLHPLFGPATTIVEARNQTALPRLRQCLEGLMAKPATEPAVPGLTSLKSQLTPASVWMILTDLYFSADSGERLAAAITRAQRRLCWVILVDLDNWPQEVEVLGHGARRIDGPGLSEERLEVEIDENRIEQVRRRINTHKDRFLKRTRRGGLSSLHWTWPARREVDPEPLFLHYFDTEPVLKRLFRRGS